MSDIETVTTIPELPNGSGQAAHFQGLSKGPCESGIFPRAKRVIAAVIALTGATGLLAVNEIASADNGFEVHQVCPDKTPNNVGFGFYFRNDTSSVSNGDFVDTRNGVVVAEVPYTISPSDVRLYPIRQAQNGDHVVVTQRTPAELKLGEFTFSCAGAEVTTTTLQNTTTTTAIPITTTPPTTRATTSTTQPRVTTTMKAVEAAPATTTLPPTTLPPATQPPPTIAETVTSVAENSFAQTELGKVRIALPVAKEQKSQPQDHISLNRLEIAGFGVGAVILGVLFYRRRNRHSSHPRVVTGSI